MATVADERPPKRWRYTAPTVAGIGLASGLATLAVGAWPVLLPTAALAIAIALTMWLSHPPFEAVRTVAVSRPYRPCWAFGWFVIAVVLGWIFVAVPVGLVATASG